MKNLIEIEDLCVTYRSLNCSTPVLNGVNFAVKERETIAIVGESGSGKSTIGKALSGLLTPGTVVTGNMRLNDSETYDLSDRRLNSERIRGKEIGHIFQDPHSSLNPRRKIKKQFSDVLVKGRNISEKDCHTTACRLLKMLNFKDPQTVLDSYPFQLSGGMCQRVSIALNLSMKPKIIIADEITSALDLKSQHELIELLKKIKKELNTGIIFITHDLQLAKQISDKLFYLSNGKLEVYDAEIRHERLCVKNKVKFNQCKKPILSIEDLNKSYNSIKVLKDISFTQNKGEVLGIWGESGCGKSTLARLICGIEENYTGTIYLGQENLRKRLEHEGRGVYRDIQIVFQDERGCLNPYKKIIDIVTEPIKNLRKDISNPSLHAEKYLRLVGLNEKLFLRKAPNLSTGQCQRVSIARSLALEPELLILDEVVSALDYDIKWQIVDLLNTIKEKTQVSLLMISHEIDVLQALCNRIAFIKDASINKIIDVDENSIDTMKNFLLENVNVRKG